MHSANPCCELLGWPASPACLPSGSALPPRCWVAADACAAARPWLTAARWLLRLLPGRPAAERVRAGVQPSQPCMSLHTCSVCTATCMLCACCGALSMSAPLLACRGYGGGRRGGGGGQRLPEWALDDASGTSTWPAGLYSACRRVLLCDTMPGASSHASTGQIQAPCRDAFALRLPAAASLTCAWPLLPVPLRRCGLL